MTCQGTTRIGVAVGIVAALWGGAAQAEQQAPSAPAAPAPTRPTLPPPQLISDNMLLLSHARTAADAAAAGNCNVVRRLSKQIRALDPMFHDTFFVVEPSIDACLTGRPLPTRPVYREVLIVDRSDPPATVTRIFGELFIGALIGGGGAIIGGLIGDGLCVGGGENHDCDRSAIGGAYLGSVLTIPLGVQLVGASGDQTGAFRMTYLGALLGGLGGLLMAANGRDDITALGLLIAPSAGAVIGFNASRRYRPRRVIQSALLHFEDGRPSIGVPLVTHAPARAGAGAGAPAVTSVTLLGGRF